MKQTITLSLAVLFTCSTAFAEKERGGGHIVTEDGKTIPYDVFTSDTKIICENPSEINFYQDDGLRFAAVLAKDQINAIGIKYPAFAQRLVKTITSVKWLRCEKNLPLLLDMSLPSSALLEERQLINGQIRQAATGYRAYIGSS